MIKLTSKNLFEPAAHRSPKQLAYFTVKRTLSFFPFIQNRCKKPPLMETQFSPLSSTWP